ncbi:MAG: hypothetical protein QQN65_03240 [Nitrosopumilus sp.]
MANKIDLKNVTLKIKDDGSEEIELKFDTGNFTFSDQIAHDYDLDRGTLDTVSLGDEIPVDISFTGRFDYYEGDSGDPTLPDALRKRGEASAWVSTVSGISGQECSPYAVDLELINTPTCSTGITNPIETLTFAQFRADSIAFDVVAGTVAVTGKCNITAPTSVRSA